MMKTLRLSCLFLILLWPATQLAAAETILDIQNVTTESGLEAWLVEDQTLPIISIDFAFRKAGSAYAPADKQGLVQLLSNTLDEGAGSYNSQEFQSLLTDHSISLSFLQSRDYFHGHLRTLSRHKDLAFELLRLALTEPHFDQDAVDRMRDANISRIRSSVAKPNWIAEHIVNDLAYSGHPYALNSGGTLSSLERITAEDLRQFSKQNLTQANIVIGVTGDLDKEELKAMMQNVFGGLPSLHIAPKKLKEASLTNQGKVAVYQYDIPQTIIRILQPGIDEQDPDYFTVVVMNYILGGGGFGSKLMESIREKHGLTYGVYSSLNNLENASLLSVSTSTQNTNVEELISLVEAAWNEMISEPVDDQTLENAKSYLNGSLPLSLTSTRKISNLLLNLQLNERPIDYLDQRAQKINAVTTEDIQELSKNLLDQKTWLTVLVGQPENITPDIEITDLPNVY